ncbi:MAG: 2-oxoacid:acceptor oxidoreductase subunit alpha [Thiohalocapsa sp.]|nr:2-oxoacid:acceptor oxidoreductase subunit alpha [Thiohalocapsa sp.]MCF7992957.1 2-oxoacid:acceptor oxidoreductase subunit alpha [Thiohalocapsa sp.]
MANPAIDPWTRPISVAVTGSGGSGAVTAGLILLAAAARAGLFGLMMRSAGPQIRGGESAAMLRFGPRELGCMGDRFDLLASLDWGNHARFSDEISLDARSLVLADPQAGPLPGSISDSGAAVRMLALRQEAAAVAAGRPNMVAVGALGAAAGLPLDALLSGAMRTLADKGGDVLDAAFACIRRGYGEPAGTAPTLQQQPPPRWNISGNEAAGLGALRAGVRFVAAYPITPASEILEWLAPRLERLGGALLQAEDELASINMIIGASFGGVPSLTATSGPGLSLMLEGIGLAVATETPVVVVDVMRGGPSTGIPTKSEQSDLDAALHGLHGDAPHLVLAALGIGDCTFTVDWATRLAERLQSVAIVLSDQSLGQSRAIIDPVPPVDGIAPRGVVPSGAAHEDDGYRRYAPTDDGISPMALPGTPGCTYTADGLEHDPRGTPSSRSTDHRAQLDKRRDKLHTFTYGDAWAEIDGKGDLCLLTWGSCRGAVMEAAAQLREDGIAARVVALRLIMPLRREALLSALAGSTVMVVEQNHGGQLFRYLHGERALPAHARSLARPGPSVLRPAEIAAAARRLLQETHDGCIGHSEPWGEGL